MTFTIRQAMIDDVASIAPLFDAYRIFYEKESDLDGAVSFINDRLRLQESTIFIVLNENKEAVGFTQLYPLFSSTRMQRMFLLNDLYVSQEYRGQGLSKLLIEAAKQWAIAHHGCGVMLETSISNDIGNKLYPATGFELETHSNFYFWTNQL